MNTREPEDYEYLGLLLEGVEGSLSEERASRRPKNYNRIVRELRSLARSTSLRYSDVRQNPDLIQIRMAKIAASIPKYNGVDFRVTGVEKILGKNQYKKIKNMLLYVMILDDDWLKFLLQEYLLKFVPSGPQIGIRAELQFLAKIAILPVEERRTILSRIYSLHNLEKQIETGLDLMERFISFQFIDTKSVKQRQRPRGYEDKGNYRPISEKRRKQSMKEISQEIERTREAILLKQMKIFEETLDKILKIQDCSNRRIVKQIIQNQEESLVENYQNQGETKYEKETYEEPNSN